MRAKSPALLLCLIVLTGLMAFAPAQTHASQICNAECMASIVSSPAFQSTSQPTDDIVIVCPSGVGQVICELIFNTPPEISIILELCEKGLIDPQICSSLTPETSSVQLSATCPLVVNYNLIRAARGCTDLDRDEACYGSREVTSIPANLFVAPVEIVDLPPIIALEHRGYNLNAAQFSFSVANSHADLHIDVEGGLRMLMFGGVRVENDATEAEAVQLPEQAVEVILESTATLFDRPADDGEQTSIAQVTAGNTLLVDALSADEAWARVLHLRETPFGVNPNAWVSTDSVVFPSNVVLDDLPKVAVDDYTSMHSFYYLQNPVATPECAPALGSTLLLQAPRDVETTFIVNDVEVLLTDTVELQYASEDNDTLLEVRVVSGIAIINPGTENAEIVAPGYAVRIELADRLQNLGADGSANDYTFDPAAEWNTPIKLSKSVIEGMATFETIPVELLNQLIDAPLCSAESQGQDCDIEYDSEEDAALIEKLCTEGILSDELDVCN